MTEREEALEEAAKIFEGQVHSEWFGHEAADAIRALKSSSPPPKGGEVERLRLRSALEIAGDQFDFYAKEHRQKARASRGNGLEAAAVAADEKAETNERFARLCRAALFPDGKATPPDEMEK